MAEIEESFHKLFAQLRLHTDQPSETFAEAQQRRTKKKTRKPPIDPQDQSDEALNRLKKHLDEVYRAYEVACKAQSKASYLHDIVAESEKARQPIVETLKGQEKLIDGFKKKYEDEFQAGKAVETEETEKRKALIGEIQQEIKVMQDNYEKMGKERIEKLQRSQMLRYEVEKLEAQLNTSTALWDAQLQKKNIETEIQAKTINQKIELMESVKGLKKDLDETIAKSQETGAKIKARNQQIKVKEDQHATLLAKTHLVFQNYKKLFVSLKETVIKKEEAALLSARKLRENEKSSKDYEAKIAEADAQIEAQTKQLNVLLNLQVRLKGELGEN